MIWDSRTDAGGCSEIVSHLTAEIHAVCGEGCLGHAVNVSDLAHAVESYLEDDASGTYVDRAYLATLAAQALSGVGERGAARRLFLFGTDCVSPSEWIASGIEALWMLDLNRITVRSDAALELVLFRSLNTVVESIADVWDGSRGRGVLGLRNVHLSAVALLGDRKTKQASLRLAREIQEYCLEKFERVRLQRNWEAIPVVMNLDGAGS